MGDLEKLAVHMSRHDLLKRAMETTMSPCPFGGGDCVEIAWRHTSDSEGNQALEKVASCTKARAVGHGGFGYGARMEALSEAECPQPKHTFFGGWKCRYADGDIHSY